MAAARKLITDADFAEAEEKQLLVRVFRDDHLVEGGGVLVRFTSELAVIQAGVGDVAYYPRSECEFFALRKR